MTGLLLALAVAASAAPVSPVTLKTLDGWTLAADYRAPRKGFPVVILVHGMASSKGEWIPFAERLSAAGLGSLAVDLRGHAGSTHAQSGTRTYRDIDVTGEWPSAVSDVVAARKWLDRKLGPGRVGFVGASIGANLVSQAAASDPPPLFLVLLSAGGDYRGVKLFLRPGLKTLAAASKGDDYSFQTLEAMTGVEKLEAPAGHGAQMFSDPAVMKRLVEWISAAAPTRPTPGR